MCFCRNVFKACSFSLADPKDSASRRKLQIDQYPKHCCSRQTMQYNSLLAICSGTKYTRCVYVESGTNILCNLRGSLHIVSELLPAGEDVTIGTDTRTVAVKQRTLSAWTSLANLATWMLLRQCAPAEAMVTGKLPFR